MVRSDGPFRNYTVTFNVWDGFSWSSTGTSGPFSYYTGNEYNIGNPVPLPPSGIYIEVTVDSHGVIRTNLFVRIQMSGFATGAWLVSDSRLSISDYSSSFDNGAPLNPATYRNVLTFPYSPSGCVLVPEYPNGERLENSSQVDLSDFALRMNGPVAYETRRFPITAEHWHNLIFSVDLSGRLTSEGRNRTFAYTDCPTPDCIYIDSGGPQCVPQQHLVADTGEGGLTTVAPKMWLALDDVDKPLLDPNSSTPHAIAPDAAWSAAGVSRSSTNTFADAFSSFVIRETTRSGGGLPVWDYVARPAPGKPFGLPAAGNVFDAIRRVEMGELHAYIGKTVNTSSEAKRRAFVTAKGKPVTDAKVTDKIMGGVPTIKLHGSGNWIKGKNTGGLKGNFTPKAKIRKYVPDPSLHGPQSPADLK